MQYANDLVDIVPENGQATVITRVDNCRNFFRFVIQVNADDFVMRNHDVIHGDPFEVEYADEHAPIAIRNPAAGVVHYRSQFFASQCMRVRGAIANAE